MNAARKNVTPISHLARVRAKLAGPAREPLDECREMSVLGLAEALEYGLATLVGQLVGKAESAPGMELYNLYMNGMELARDRGEAIRASFREHFLARFNRECRREGGHFADGLNAELSLLEPDDLEETLASGTLANAIFNASSEELFGLGKRMGLLINDPELSHGDNPLGPEVIGQSVLAALKDQDASIKERLLLASMLSQHLPARVRALYQDINQRLVERNVLPTIRVGLKRQTVATAPGSGFVASAPASATGGGELLGLLRQLVGGTAGPAAYSASAFIPAPALPGETAANDAPSALSAAPFFQALNQLQHGQPVDAALTKAEAEALDDGRGNVLRALRGGGLAGLMSRLDAMTLDIVAMMFDYILGDDRIPDAIKALIGRLQIPVLKVAMIDKAFFSQKNHPARQLLDVLAEAAVGWDPAEGHDSGLYLKIEALINAIIARFDDDTALFESAVEDLRAWLDDEAHQADAASALSALTLHQRELLDQGRQVGHGEVESSLVGHPVPGVIRQFLAAHWETLLAMLYAKAGCDSEAWQGAIATMNDLIWSVAPKAGMDDRKRLIALLPGMLKRLDEGVQYLGLAEATRNRFFASLVKCHAEAVKAGMLDQEEDSPAADEASAFADDEVPVLDEAVDFEPVEPVAEADASDLAVVAPVDDRPGHLAAPSLKRGAWIAYAQDDGVEVRAKLSWVSPLKGIYLFTNRQGQRAMSISADRLAAKLGSGEVRVLDAAPLTERAVDSMMEQLNRHVA